ncbi:MAG: BolA family protein [Deltaproteobacteria bacterium]|nr:BolA family protein [Deltaproteobacteria bacterium]
MKPEAITAKIRASLPDAVVSLKDLTGTEDHWEAQIISTAFAGKSLIARHRLVMAALADELKGPIHALTLDVKTPEEAGR